MARFDDTTDLSVQRLNYMRGLRKVLRVCHVHLHSRCGSPGKGSGGQPLRSWKGYRLSRWATIVGV